MRTCNRSEADAAPEINALAWCGWFHQKVIAELKQVRDGLAGNAGRSDSNDEELSCPADWEPSKCLSFSLEHLDSLLSDLEEYPNPTLFKQILTFEELLAIAEERYELVLKCLCAFEPHSIALSISIFRRFGLLRQRLHKKEKADCCTKN
jgi:hypothetical protein